MITYHFNYVQNGVPFSGSLPMNNYTLSSDVSMTAYRIEDGKWTKLS